MIWITERDTMAAISVPTSKPGQPYSVRLTKRAAIMTPTLAIMSLREQVQLAFRLMSLLRKRYDLTS